MDQLSEQKQMLLKAASIIGRTFHLAHLLGYFPEIGNSESVRADLALLQNYDLTAADLSEPELTYLFKHIVTHQVAYESLAYATRTKLHEAYAQFLETHGDPEHALDLLAYHYDRSANLPKRKEYLQRAGQAAAARFANDEAVDYLSRALDLTDNTELDTRHALLLTRAHVFDVQGNRAAQSADLDALEQIARALGNPFQHDKVLLEQGWLAARLAEHNTAQQLVKRIHEDLASDTLMPNERHHLEIEISLLQGVIRWQQGNAIAARPFMEHALELANAQGDRPAQIRALSFLGLVLREAGENTLAQSYYAQLLAHARENSDKRREWSALNNLGLITQTRGDFSRAQENFGDALRIVREIGDRPGEALLLGNLARATMQQGEYDRAKIFAEQARDVAAAIGDRKSICYIDLTLGETCSQSGDFSAAQEYTARGLTIALELGDRLTELYARMNFAMIALNRNDWERAHVLTQEALLLAREIQHREGEAFLFNTLGQAQFARGETDAARESFLQALTIWEALEATPYSLEARAGLAEIFLQQHNARARSECNAILEFMQQHPNRAGDPSALAAQFRCYRVLDALGEENARALIETTYAQLQARAEKIRDAEMKKSFLENVPANAAIVRAWQAIHAV